MPTVPRRRRRHARSSRRLRRHSPRLPARRRAVHAYLQDVTVILPSKKRNHGPQIARLPRVKVHEAPGAERRGVPRRQRARRPAPSRSSATARSATSTRRCGCRSSTPTRGSSSGCRTPRSGQRIRTLFNDCAVLSDGAMAAPAFVAAALGDPAPSHVRVAGRTLYVARRSDRPTTIICGLADTRRSEGNPACCRSRPGQRQPGPRRRRQAPRATRSTSTGSARSSRAHAQPPADPQPAADAGGGRLLGVIVVGTVLAEHHRRLRLHRVDLPGPPRPRGRGQPRSGARGPAKVDPGRGHPRQPGAWCRRSRPRSSTRSSAPGSPARWTACATRSAGTSWSSGSARSASASSRSSTTSASPSCASRRTRTRSACPSPGARAAASCSATPRARRPCAARGSAPAVRSSPSPATTSPTSRPG